MQHDLLLLHFAALAEAPAIIIMKLVGSAKPVFYNLVSDISNNYLAFDFKLDIYGLCFV